MSGEHKALEQEKLMSGEDKEIGRSFWDYWWKAPEGNRGSLVAFSALMIALTALLLWLVGHALLQQAAGSNLKISVDPHGVWTIEKSGGGATTQTTFVVSAVGGWQDTGVRVPSQSHVNITASGFASVGAIEHDWFITAQRMEKKRKGLPAAELLPQCGIVSDGGVVVLGGAGPCFGTPMDKWTRGEPWPFVGPKGYVPATDFPAATPTAKTSVKQSPFGALVGRVGLGISPGDSVLLGEEAGILIGASHAFKWTGGTGNLWLAVNDDADTLEDNAGFFLVAITVE